DSGSNLDISDIADHHERPQGDARIHVAREVDVADGAGVGSAPMALDFVDDLHGPHLGSSRYGPGRQPGAERVQRGRAAVEATANVGRDVHDVAVTFDHHDVAQFDRAELSHATDVVPRQVDQHHVLGPL